MVEFVVRGPKRQCNVLVALKGLFIAFVQHFDATFSYRYPHFTPSPFSQRYSNILIQSQVGVTHFFSASCVHLISKISFVPKTALTNLSSDRRLRLPQLAGPTSCNSLRF